ncbi:MAG: hypothetical protein IPJ19_13645 [Planctomycetes bacterium]|nr:hypothetical protein [Planctomycetota bacterium]
MSTQTVRSILRIVAVVTVFVGLLGFSTALVGAFSVRWFANSISNEFDLRQSVASVGLFGAISWFVVMAWGCALFQMSQGLARLVASEPEETQTSSSNQTVART